MDDEGCMALILAIVHPNEITPELAFELMNTRLPTTEDLSKLRDAGLSYGQISAICGISKGAIFTRIKRRRLRATLDQEVGLDGKEQMAAGEEKTRSCREVVQGWSERGPGRCKSRD